MKRAALVMMMVMSTWATDAVAEQVPNDGPEPTYEAGDIEVRRVCATGHCGVKPRVKGHFTFGAGYGWLRGQMGEVFDDGGVTGRISTGVEVGRFAIDMVITGVSLETPLDAEPTTLSIGPSFRYTMDIARNDRWRLGYYLSSGLNFAAFSVAEEEYGDDNPVFEEYSGVGVTWGTGFVADWRMLRMYVDVTKEWFWLENAQIERHIHGGVVHVTTGLGVVF